MLEGRLSRSGIPFEIRGNPLTAVLGIPRFELFVYEGDLPRASRLCQEQAAEVETDAPAELRGVRKVKSFAETARSDLLIDAKVISPATPEPRQDNDAGRKRETGTASSESDLARATALLQEEVEALLTREGKLMERCSMLEEKVKLAEQVLAQTQTELARETANRSDSERRLAEAGEARASLEKEMQVLELRLKKSEQAATAAQAQLDTQVQQQEKLAKERRAQQEQVQAYVGTVNELRNRVRARLSPKEEQSATSSERRTRRPGAEKEHYSLWPCASRGNC